ncbi:MAG: hypothetical protein ACLGHG_10000 [Gammaproteobacteria bacterium]
MNFLRILPVAALLAASASVQAGNFSYDYLEGSFGELDRDADAIYLGGAMSLDTQFGLLGSLGIIDYPGGDGMVLRGGGLFHKSVQQNLDLFGTLELVYSDFEYGPVGPFGQKVSDDDLGLAAAVGLRFELQDNFHLEGKLTLTEVDPFDDGLGLSANARYYMDKQWSAALGVASDAEFDGLFLNLRYNLK